MNKNLEERKTVGWRKRKCLHLVFCMKTYVSKILEFV